MTVARMFFSNSPAWNRELYEAIQQQMQRDWSPTYWFRVMRAQQLLALYREDPDEFANLSQEYRSQFSGNTRAPHRLSVWLKRDDLVFRSGTMHAVSRLGDLLSSSINPRSCLFTGTQEFSLEVTGGTGQFAHAKGIFTGTVSGRALLVRNPDGSCSLTQVPRLEVDKFAESGTLSF